MSRVGLSLILWLVCLAASWVPAHAQNDRLVIGSKAHTEGVILGEVARLYLRENGVDTVHKEALGGTQILYGAAKRGEIDIYIDYTGTLRYETFARDDVESTDALVARLSRDGLGMTRPLGFDNTYAIAMRRERAEVLNIITISDLLRYPDLVFGFSTEFMDRADGWRAMKAAYGLPHRANGMQHDLSYRGLADGSLDVIDAYATDAEIAYYDLVVLEDDRGFFPNYEAVYIYRQSLESTASEALSLLRELSGTISADAMQEMNRRVKLDGEAVTAVAADFVSGLLQRTVQAEKGEVLLRRIGQRTMEHLKLVTISLAAAICIAVPLAVAAFRFPRLGAPILGIVGTMQTIPALALFVFMIPLLGIGAAPTIAALFLYSLLPIVRNGHTGLVSIAPELTESAMALGLPRHVRLLRIELPLAFPTLLAGIKTAAVINVGAATLGALIGAGGLGQPILTGIRLDDIGLILEGAIPAALLAFAVTGLFDLIERGLTPHGLRL